MSVTYIPEKVKLRLWGLSGGRCQYDGCNRPLWIDQTTKVEFNAAYIAHIVADKPGGPRGNPHLSFELSKDISNLMLLCDAHHRLVDIEDEDGHPVERLRKMKHAHEARLVALGDIAPNKQSHVVLYGANIGVHGAPLSLKAATEAMVPDRYPAEPIAIELGLGNSALHDADPTYWMTEESNLRAQVRDRLRPRLQAGDCKHLSIFALAPQPMLILLGHLISDIPATTVYQRRREPPTWRWAADDPMTDYIVEGGDQREAPPALVFALSATVSDDRILSALPGSNVWRITVQEPSNDFVIHPAQVLRFRSTLRRVFNEIKAFHGEDATIHVFPAMPVALAVEVGRVHMPKADLPLKVYDQNRSLGGFVGRIEIGLPK